MISVRFPTKGDRIYCSLYNLGFTIETVLYQSYFEGLGYDIEFLDDYGNYHHWCEAEDQGRILYQKRGD